MGIKGWRREVHCQVLGDVKAGRGRGGENHVDCVLGAEARLRSWHGRLSLDDRWV